MQLTYMIQVNLFSILILTIIYFGMRQKKEEPSVQKRIFYALVIINLLLLLFDFMVDFLGYFQSPQLFIPLFAVSTFLYILIPVPGFLWLLYIEYFIFKDLTRLRKWKRILVIPIYFNIILVAINLFTPIMFVIYPNGTYERGSLFFFVVGLSYAYLFAALIHTIKHKNAFRKRDLLPLLLFAIPVAIGGFFQSFYFGLLTVWTSLSLSILMIYLFIQSKIIQSDYLTGLYNLREFDVKISDLSKKNLKNTNIALLLMDIDHFKNINDKYGHPMGDLALQAFSNVLRYNFRIDDFVARLGGDEFGALLVVESKDDLTKVIKRLKSSLEDYNSYNHLPFELDFSYGYGVFEGDSKDSFYDFIKQIDDQMYVQKHKKKSGEPIIYDTGNHY